MYKQKNQILQLAKKYRDIVSRDLGIDDSKIIEVFFFLEFMHPPIVRIDGGSLSYKQAQQLESDSPFVMVRMVEMHQKNITVPSSIALQDHQILEDQKEYNNLKKIIIQVAPDIDWDILKIWEVEVEDDNVVVRCFADDSIDFKSKIIDGIYFEFVDDVNIKNGTWLLQVFDDAKKKNVLFLSHLNSFLKK